MTRSALFMPEKYKDLPKEELINAFFAENYELMIAITDPTIVESIFDFIKTSIKNSKFDNNNLWKHFWLDYFNYVMQRMKYNYFCDVLKKEKFRLENVDETEFKRMIAIFNVSSKVLTHGDAVIECPRLLDEILGDDRVESTCQNIFEIQDKLIEIANKYSDMFKFKVNYYNTNKYFDIGMFVVNSLIMLNVNAMVAKETLYKCLSGVIIIEDEDKFNKICEEICNIVPVISRR